MNKTRPGRRLWLFRAQKRGRFEATALQENLLVLDFNVRGDLSDHYERDMIAREILDANPDASSRQLETMTTQMHTLLHGMMPGDLVLCPLRMDNTVAVALVRPEVDVSEEGLPGRRIEWLKTGTPKSSLQPDLQHSIEAVQNVASIARNDAIARVEELLRVGIDPGPSGAPSGAGEVPTAPDQIEAWLHARLVAKIGSSFAGHQLAVLVAAVLEADGYICRVSPPGPDGGVDISAGRGIAGLGEALVVQVKSGDIRADAPTLQQLVGAMTTTGAAQGLLVAWGGITRAVSARLDSDWFRVRVWDADDLVRAIIRTHDALPLPIRDRLAMKRVWIA